MEHERTTALCQFLRFLAGNPDGDAATRALILGALAPTGVAAGQVYAFDGELTLELVGNYGFDEEDAANYRVLPVTMPLPICEAFTSLASIVVNRGELAARYPILQSDPSVAEDARVGDAGHVMFVPILYRGVAVGAMTLLQEEPDDWGTGDWQLLDGITAALALWMNNQREILVDHWRRAAPLPLREVRISERQRQILELIGIDRTNGEIARELGYSIPTIKKDLQQIMRVLGTVDRRSTAGRAREIGLLPERRRGE